MLVDMANVKPSIYNALVIAGIVVIMIPLLKYAANRFPIPGFTPLVNAV
jgi:hypothetical protein